jgi:chromosomal replication initiator protein
VSTVSSSIDLCARIAGYLEDALGTKKYHMWFDRSARFEFDDQSGSLCIEVPNRFVADWIARHFDEQIQIASQRALGQSVTWRVEVNPNSFASERPETLPTVEQVAPAPRRQRREVQRLRHSLDDFIVGPSNELAHTAALRMVDHDLAPIHPLFIHGGCGLGKTHLLQGICERMIQLHPNARVLYLTGEQFTNEFLTAVRSNLLVSFRKRIRKLDLLAIDDVRFFANKQATQQEFLHSFDAIELGGAKLVLASDNHPRMIKQFSESLVSRCIRGMVVQVSPPDHATRLRIVQALGLRRRLVLNRSVVELIADYCRDSIREIEGVLTKIHALAHLTGRTGSTHTNDMVEVGHSLVDHLFKDELAQQTTRRAVRFADVLTIVCEHLHVTREQVLGGGRHRQVVLARSLVIYLTREMTSMSFPEIAMAMGRKGHSTIITAFQRVQRQIANNTAVLLPHLDGQSTVSSISRQLQHTIARG